MFANKILSEQHKDKNFVQIYELRMNCHIKRQFLEAFQKFTDQKSLSTYIKSNKCFVEPK